MPDLDQSPVPNVHPCRKGEPNLIDDPAFAVGLAIWQARLARVNGAPFPEVIRDLLLGHAIEGDVACELILHHLGSPANDEASFVDFVDHATGLEPLMEGDRS